VRSYLADAPDGAPRINIFAACENLIRTLPALVYDRHDREDAAAGEDHAPESLRYALMSRPGFSAHVQEAGKQPYNPLKEETRNGGFWTV
jgi:hypothetical protein